jgi:hypothetical protein
VDEGVAQKWPALCQVYVDLEVITTLDEGIQRSLSLEVEESDELIIPFHRSPVALLDPVR